MSDLRDTGSRRELPLLTVHGGRSRLTCLYRCGNACDHPVPNTSDNPYFGDILAEGISRRSLLKAGALTGLVVGVGGVSGGQPAAAARVPTATAAERRALTFTPVTPNRLDDIVVPRNYGYRVVVRWGDPVLPGAPPFDPRHQTAAAQAMQFGYNCDYLCVKPFPRNTEPGTAVRQSRVHRRAADVLRRRDRYRCDNRRAEAHRDGRARPFGRGD